MSFGEYVKDFDTDLESFNENKIRSGADVARELGITRVAVKKTTQKAITKIYNAVQSTFGKEYTPFQVLLHIVSMLNVENETDGMKTIFKNLSSDQKNDVLKDIKITYPQYATVIENLDKNFDKD